MVKAKERTRPKAKRPASGKATSRRTVSQQRKRKNLRLLIVEGDTPRLINDGLSLGSPLQKSLEAFSPSGAVIDLVLAKPETLLADLGKLSPTYDVVILIGHSNQEVFQLLEKKLVKWGDLAREWLAPFSPKTVIVIGCSAGHLPSMRVLFQGISSLREVYASPSTVNRDQALAFVAVAIHRLWRRKLADDALGLIQLLGFLLRGGQLWRWERKQCLSTSDLDGFGMSMAAEWLTKFWNSR